MRKIFLLIACLLSIFGFAQDGSLDLSFNPGVGPNGYITKVALQSDNKIIIFGGFTTYNGVYRNKIARLNSDGSLDNSFNNISNNGTFRISSLELQNDGKIIISSREGWNWNGLYKISRLNPDGTTDGSFVAELVNGSISNVALQSDGKIIAKVYYFETEKEDLIRFNSNGSIDPSFNLDNQMIDYIDSMLLLPDGKIIIAYGGTTPQNNFVHNISRLNSDGSFDESFETREFYSFMLALQSDKKIIATVNYDWGFAFPPVTTLFRLNANGAIDDSFISVEWITGNPYSANIQTDGKIVSTGYFESYNAPSFNNIVRLNTNGTLDTSFDSGSGPNDSVSQNIIQPDGKIIIIGEFTEYNGVPRNRIARIIGDSRLAVNPFEEKRFAFYPNPVKDILHLSLPEENSIGEYEIYDLVSKRIVANSLNENQIDVSNLCNGVYILKIKTDNGVFASKFIKE